MSTKLYFFFRPKWGAYAATTATATKTSLQKCVSPRCFNYTLSRLFHLVRIHFVNSKLLTNSSVGGWILKDCIKLQEKKETESRCLVFTVSSSKLEIRHQVIGCAATTKKCIKKNDARVELFFCFQNQSTVFWRCRSPSWSSFLKLNGFLSWVLTLGLIGQLPLGPISSLSKLLQLIFCSIKPSFVFVKAFL